MQLPFILSVPLWIFFPVWSVILGVLVFWALNSAICRLLNGGSKIRFHSDPKYAQPKNEHKHEQWIFLNGVAVGRHWLESNINRLALTFGRPILGIHNKTNGILFDVIQCLIQRNFDYATNDIRDCYKVMKDTLYNRDISKVVFILHSQGGIEGGMILDWLLQELPQDLLTKLEVYTFGNAANHFNNPHLHLLSQNAALSYPNIASTTKTITRIHYHDLPTSDSTAAQSINQPHNTKPSRETSSSGKTIRHIEHYAHTCDFVARWGVINFTCDVALTPTAPRYMGRVFEQSKQGHQFNQHYLDSTFPLQRSSSRNGGIAGSGFDGCAERSEFMDSAIEIGSETEERESLEASCHRADTDATSNEDEATIVRDYSPITPSRNPDVFRDEFTNGRGFTNGDVSIVKRKFKVKDLSRLWLYRNGRSPELDEIDVGIARMATI